MDAPLGDRLMAFLGKLRALGSPFATASDRLLETGPAVISFNRFHWCPCCWFEHALASAQPEISRRGGSIVSIVPDRQEFVRRLPRENVERLSILSVFDTA